MLPFDEILSRYLGEFGWYQGWVMFLMCLAELTGGFHQLAANFIAASPAHHCSVPGLQTVHGCLLTAESMNMSIPWALREGGGQTYSRCTRYNVSEGSFNVSSTDFWQDHSPESLSAGGSISCDSGWEYDCTTFTSTIVTEWNLVCATSWLKQLTTSLYMAGVFVGALMFGDMSDRFGRRPAILLSLLVQCVFGVATAFSPNLVLFIIFRMFVGAGTSGVLVITAVIMAEFVGPKYRLKMAVLRGIFYSVGGLFLAGMGYGIRDWSMLQLVISLVSLIFIPYYWWLPESPRWLMSRDQFKAKEIILKMAKMNRVVLPSDVFEEELEEMKATNFKKVEKQRMYTILDLLRTPNTRKKTFIILYMWFTGASVYYGIALNIGDLSGNIYFNSLIAGAMEIPAMMTLLLLQERFGRKIPSLFYLLMTGLGLIMTSVLTAGTGRVVVAMVTRFCITAGFQCIVNYTVELYPTVTRNIGTGFSSTAGRVGAIISPFAWLLSDVWRPAPYILFGVVVMLAGLLCMLLPETKGQQLPQTLEDGEEFGKRMGAAAWNRTLVLLHIKRQKLKGESDVHNAA